MSRKNGIHLSGKEQFQLFITIGFCCEDAKLLSDITSSLTFKRLDELFEAIKIIKKGEV